MGLGDIFKANENKQLKDRISELEAMLSPEQRQMIDLRAEISNLEQTISQKKAEIVKYGDEIANRQQSITQLNSEIAQKRAQSSSLDEMLMFESFGLYTPRYNFTKADQYKQTIDALRKDQKAMISNNTAVLGATNWTVNGSASQGQKMVKDMQKLLLRAFNSECDELVEKVKYNNFDASLKRINASCDAISKLGKMMNISISNSYRQAKINELTLAFEYATKKQEEKEAEKEARARLREEAKLMKEIEEERKKIEKEQTHYMNALAKLNLQLSENPESADLLAKKAELEGKIADTEKAMKDVDYREANKRAGYVYVISNVGAFGENVYKIGMTRRLDPQERVDELGDASVPFAFDVHAMIFTDDAPRLEAALHKAFESKKVNMVNPRREFFRVSLDEIKAVIRQNYDKTVEFTDVPDAEQWRISMKMRGEIAEPSSPQILSPMPVENLAQTAIKQILEKYPTAECTYTEENGIFSIVIKDRGTLRISNNGRIKCDYLGSNGVIAFSDNIEKICSYI